MNETVEPRTFPTVLVKARRLTTRVWERWWGAQRPPAMVPVTASPAFGGLMHVAKERPLVETLLAEPHDPGALLAVYEAIGKDASAYAALLVAASQRTTEAAAASHWLTEAARVHHQAFEDDRAAVRLLESALERDPLNLRAAELLVELHRSRREDRELTNVLRRRADWLKERYASENVAMPRAVAAFEQLSTVYEELGDADEALASLRRAFDLERARNPSTTPSPPASQRASSLQSPASSVRGAPPPEPRWSAPPISEARDTLPSPLPTKEDSSPEGSRRRPEPPKDPGDPLLKVIEALHGLRRSEEVVDGATFVLRTALEAIPSVAGFVHVCDVATRDMVVVAASGAQNAEIIGTRTTEADPLIARAQKAMQAVTVDASALSVLKGNRWRALCPVRTVLCAPIHYDGRQFGAIELVDPTSSQMFRDADRHAMTYIGERFGEFLSDRSMTF